MYQDVPQRPDDDDVAGLLAYYDARKVPEAKLCQIFRCTAADLANARASDDYKDAVAGQTSAITDQAVEIDDRWNHLEHNSLGTLIEAMPAISDPRMLLGMAVQANKAARRNGGTVPNSRDAVINVDAQQAGTSVVRLRTRFLEVLQDPDGAKRITERQIQVDTLQGGDLREDLSPQQVKRILRENIGVNPDEVALRKTFGPDMAIELDFSKIGEE